MTMYEWDGTGEDPNLPPILCPECTEGWVEHWEDMWSHVHG